jgi:hypothetical protein
MDAYRTTRTVRLAAGTVLVLSPDQAEPRSHLLYGMEPGVYTAKEPLEFKVGETIGLMTPPRKGDSGLERIGPLNIIYVDALAEDEPKFTAGEPYAEEEGVALFVGVQLIDTQNEQNTRDDDQAENPGAASAQSELKKDSAVQTQASEAAAEKSKPKKGAKA